MYSKHIRGGFSELGRYEFQRFDGVSARFSRFASSYADQLMQGSKAVPNQLWPSECCYTHQIHIQSPHPFDH